MATPTKKYLKEKQGLKSTQSDKDFEVLLNNVEDLFDADELEQIRLAYEYMNAQSSTKRKAELIRPIVPIDRWINDAYYLGPDEENTYSFWKDEAVKVFNKPPEERINQIILTGAIGTGKSTFAVLCIIRVIYELSCYKHIASLFNLFGVSRIAFAYLSVTKTQAQMTGFALLVEWIDSIPYFREMFTRRKGIDSMIIWPQERLMVTFGSVANHFIGMNLIGSILDEANFFSGRDRENANIKMNSKVSELYTQIVTRSESRFIINGVNHSISILISSSTVESSFTEETIEASKDDPHTHVVSPSVWDVKPQNYCGDKFFVYTGGDNVDPFVIEDLSDFNMLLENKKMPKIEHNLRLEDAFQLLPPIIQANLIKVPIEHAKAFRGDIIIALQDLAGYSVSSANRLFTSETVYNKALNGLYSHPFSRESIVLSTTKEPLQAGFIPIKSYLLNGVKFNNPRQPHYIHLDLALTGDSVGIAMTHISGWKTIYKQESVFDTAEESKDSFSVLGKKQDQLNNPLIEDEIKIPKVAVDFMLKIDPPKKPNKISLGKIRDFIVYLRNVLKINIELVTADQFQSAQMLQELDELGFGTAGLSVDRTADAYLTFTNLMYEERIDMYHYEPFKKELFGVVYYPAKRKVDHTAKGSKDVSDAVVGATFSAVKAEDKTDVHDHSLVELFMEANKADEDILYKQRVKKVIGGLEELLKKGLL